MNTMVGRAILRVDIGFDTGILSRPLLAHMGGFPKFGALLNASPFQKDRSMLGSIFGVHIFWKPPNV